MKKIVILTLIVFLLTTIVQPVAAVTGIPNFKLIKTYQEGTFTDVMPTEWYYPEIANAYSYGIVNGIGNDIFDPDNNMTIAEAIAVATRIYSIYNGGTGIVSATDSSIWYSGNLSYAEKNGIVMRGEFDGRYDNFATRAELVHIYSHSVAQNEFTVKNNIDKIPDVIPGTLYYDEIMTMYKAGVVVGIDAQGHFMENTNVTRAEATAILNRIIDSSKRKLFAPVKLGYKSSFEMFEATGKYVKGNGKIYGNGDCLFDKSVYTDLSDDGIKNNLKWYITIDPNGGPTYDPINYECEIDLVNWNFGLETRHQVRDALKVIYPTGYEQVYDCMMKALNFDLWEAGSMNTMNATSGTMWTRTADGRAINIQFQYDVGTFIIYFYKTGFMMEPPTQESEASAKAEAQIAKNFGGWLSEYEPCQLGTY